MTTATTPSATVTLPIGFMQDMRVRNICHATLTRLKLRRTCAYWASEEGRIRMNNYDCGRQDAITEAIGEETFHAVELETVAESLAAAIREAGYTPIEHTHGCSRGTIMLLCHNAAQLDRKTPVSGLDHWLIGELTSALARMENRH